VTWPWWGWAQHEATQPGAERADDLSRQGSCKGPAVRGEPALAPEAHDLRAQHQVLHEKGLVALEARAGGNGLDGEKALLMDLPFGALGPLAPPPTGRVRLRGCSGLFHTARLDPGPAIESL
jgi:hypothetical protein